jgi:septal ring factor EnvC (AmiA/AmiB activator)
MSQVSKVRQSRTQWKHKATQRANQNRYWRKQLARVRTERDRTTKALKETQARLRQLEAQSQGLVMQPKVDLVFLALQLF